MFSSLRIPILWMSALFALAVGTMVSEGATYTVRSGDTLYSIATRNKLSVSGLMKANGITDPRKLRVGQRLTLSSSGSSTRSSSGSSGSSGSSCSTSSRVSSVGKGKWVVIDPGHGGRDQGATRSGVKESSLNLRIAGKLREQLRQRGYSVAMTRASDVFISLSRRAVIANQYRNAVFVSIHFNVTRETWVRGVETYYAGSQGRSLAAAIQREMVNRLKVVNRGVRSARFTVLMETKCPAVLVECGFISNSSERSRCASSSYQSAVALAIAEGITRYRWN